jgi:hypothetical protein
MGCGCKNKKPVAKPTNSDTQITKPTSNDAQTQTNNNQGGN